MKKLLLFDSKTNLTTKLDVHSLHIKTNWNVVDKQTWEDFSKYAAEHVGNIGGIAIHTTDADRINSKRCHAAETLAAFMVKLELKIPIIFFTGAGGVPSEYETALTQAGYAGPINSFDDLTYFTKAMGEYGRTNNFDVFIVSKLEIVLQVLSALLPFSWYWDLPCMNKDTIVKTFNITPPSVLEDDIMQLSYCCQRYIFELMSNNDAPFKFVDHAKDQCMNLLNRLDKMLNDGRKSDDWVDVWEHTPPETTIGLLEMLALSDQSNWCKRLRSLRDVWLSACDMHN